MLALRPEQGARDVEALFHGRINDGLVRGDWSSAEKAAKELLRVIPGSLFGHLSLAGALHGRGRHGAAEELTRKAALLDWRRLPRREDQFICLMKLGAFADAFAVAEQILDHGSFLHPHELFWNPWGNFPRKPLAWSAPSPWTRYYSEASVKFPVARYGWMNVKAGMALLAEGRYAQSCARFKAALSYRPTQWSMRGYFAEALLCAGRPAEARRQLSLAVEEAPKEQRGFALAWQGEIELWLGRYRRAYALLDEACSLGTQHAFCWRGAAALKLGRRREAVRLLDEALERFPIDHESYVWRGQAKRELGLLREALADFERAPGALWSLWNSALAFASLGEPERCLDAFKRIDRDIVDRLCRKLRRPRPKSPREVVRFLEAGLRLSRGFRRDDYNQRVWLPAR
jgi:tetratricopeptide (TPR) repeat protein